MYFVLVMGNIFFSLSSLSCLFQNIPSKGLAYEPFKQIGKTLIIPVISMADCVCTRHLFDDILRHQIIWQPYYNLLEVLTIFPLFVLSCVNGNAISFHGVNKFHRSLANVLLTVS